MPTNAVDSLLGTLTIDPIDPADRAEVATWNEEHHTDEPSPVDVLDDSQPVAWLDDPMPSGAELDRIATDRADEDRTCSGFYAW